MGSGNWPEGSEDSASSYATAHSQQVAFASAPSPQHHRDRSGDSLLGYTDLDTPPRENRCSVFPCCMKVASSLPTHGMGPKRACSCSHQGAGTKRLQANIMSPLMSICSGSDSVHGVIDIPEPFLSHSPVMLGSILNA